MEIDLVLLIVIIFIAVLYFNLINERNRRLVAENEELKDQLERATNAEKESIKYPSTH